MSSQPKENKVKAIEGRAVAVRGNDIDTDRIIPARYLKVVRFDGLGEFAFNDVRYDEDGKATDHPFNDPRHAEATILLANKNFGCGSSREHAPQALMRWGIRAVVGESLAEIFAGNCNALGIPAVTVSEDDIGRLMQLVEEKPESNLTVDLVEMHVATDVNQYRCDMPAAFREALLSGKWDTTAVLLENLQGIQETASQLPYLSWATQS